MTINDMKQTKFNEASFTEWEQAAVKSLKGKSLESLETKTLEEIILKPLYTLADLENIPDEQTKTVRESKESAMTLHHNSTKQEGSLLVCICICMYVCMHVCTKFIISQRSRDTTKFER